jgi:hypothetical protein
MIGGVGNGERQVQIAALASKSRTFAGVADWELLPVRTRWKAKNANREIGVLRVGHNVTHQILYDADILLSTERLKE